ncbi:hypothetical protein PI125_g16797 [Phytophthora idaei]|nr:hypothetical protein PI125_g16797 [Phytophthora idaei]
MDLSRVAALKVSSLQVYRTRCRSSHSGNCFESWRVVATSLRAHAASHAAWTSDILGDGGTANSSAILLAAQL